MQKHYQYEHKFTIFSSRNNLPKINNMANDLQLNENKWIWTQWVAFPVNFDNGSTQADVKRFDGSGAVY